MVDTTTDIRIGAAIDPAFHSRIQAIRAAKGFDPGDPEKGPTMSACIREALEAWVPLQEAALRALGAM